MSQTNLIPLNKFKVGDKVYLNWEKMEEASPDRSVSWKSWCLKQRYGIFNGESVIPELFNVLIEGRIKLLPKEGVELSKNKIVIEIIKDL